jgi:hypothetical protein
MKIQQAVRIRVDIPSSPLLETRILSQDDVVKTKKAGQFEMDPPRSGFLASTKVNQHLEPAPCLSHAALNASQQCSPPRP